MITPQLIDYIHQALATGASREKIKNLLLSNGWSGKEVGEAFAVALPKPSVTKTPPPASRTVRKVLTSFAFIITSAVYAIWLYLSNQHQSSVVATNATTVPQTTVNIPAQVQIPVDITPSPIVQPLAVTPPPSPPPLPKPKPKPIIPKSIPPPPPVPPPTLPPPLPPPPPPKLAGLYVDGSYTGDAADAYYGMVQVKAIITNGQLADVQFLQHPNDRRTSQQINDQAMPMLTTEAIQSQSANVDIISGATDTSQAFIDSLGSALAQAKN